MLTYLNLKQKGFTLVEILVAAVLFSILSAGITTMMAVLILSNDFARDMTEATTLGENKIEDLVNTEYVNISQGWNWDSPSPDYRRIWLVENDSPQSGMKRIQVFIIWHDTTGKSHSVRLETILST